MRCSILIDNRRTSTAERLGIADQNPHGELEVLWLKTPATDFDIARFTERFPRGALSCPRTEHRFARGYTIALAHSTGGFCTLNPTEVTQVPGRSAGILRSIPSSDRGAATAAGGDGGTGLVPELSGR